MTTDRVQRRCEQIAFRVLPSGERMPTSVVDLRKRIMDEVRGDVQLAEAGEDRRQELDELRSKMRQLADPSTRRTTSVDTPPTFSQ